MTRYRLASTLLVVTLALSVQFCGGGSDSGPDTPTVPVPVPSATPEPPPVGEAPLSESCAALEPGVRQEDASCSTGPEHFLDEMNDAIDEVRARFPEYFGEGRNVVNVGAYYVEIIRALDRMGLCAETGGEEVGVKRSAAFNDQFDILTARSEYRNGDSIFLGSCSPAVIQVGARPRHPIPEGCTLPRSTWAGCGRPQSRYFRHVDEAIGRMMDDHPELFDFSDINPGTDWPRVTNIDAYQQGVVDLLAQQGYCAFFDGEEIQMKRTNEFSEHYDVNYKDEYVRRGEGTYRGACYPAAF